MTNETERAEIIQSIQAFLIPSSLFLAVIINSAGGFLVYNGYPVGWALVAFGCLVIISAFVAFFRFQNKLRAAGDFSSSTAQPVSPGESAQNSIRTAITLDDPNKDRLQQSGVQDITLELPPLALPATNPPEAVR